MARPARDLGHRSHLRHCPAGGRRRGPGAIFAIEVILGQFHTLYFGAVVISAVVADVVAQAFTHEVRAFDVPQYAMASPWELGLYAVLGAIAAVLSVAYSRGLYLIEDVWQSLRIKEWVKPAIGGLVLGAIGILTFKIDGFPRVFGVGCESISDALLGRLTLQVTVALLFLKMLATWTTLGSGGSGGVFAPALFMGSMLGASFGNLVMITDFATVPETMGLRHADIVRAYNQALAKRGQELQKAEALGLGQIEELSLIQAHLRTDSPAVGRPVSDLEIPDHSLIVSLCRGTEQKVVRGTTILAPGDVLTVVAQRSGVAETRRRLIG